MSDTEDDVRRQTQNANSGEGNESSLADNNNLSPDEMALFESMAQAGDFKARGNASRYDIYYGD